jgi:hypothetical protein
MVILKQSNYYSIEELMWMPRIKWVLHTYIYSSSSWWSIVYIVVIVNWIILYMDDKYLFITHYCYCCQCNILHLIYTIAVYDKWQLCDLITFISIIWIWQYFCRSSHSYYINYFKIFTNIHYYIYTDLCLYYSTSIAIAYTHLYYFHMYYLSMRIPLS